LPDRDVDGRLCAAAGGDERVELVEEIARSRVLVRGRACALVAGLAGSLVHPVNDSEKRPF
jgi:hypothetical protein